jgi:hypothetical protein
VKLCEKSFQQGCEMLKMLMRYLLFFFAFFPALLPAQTPAAFASLNFLLGTWEAKTAATGSAGASVLGAYTFQTRSTL